ncbi:MAG: hypothetical protein P4M15_06565 [Alphaproteobacteria bacterium]|nr:hypothetical protein [Alphaproteobacteria bacterium]
MIQAAASRVEIILISSKPFLSLKISAACASAETRSSLNPTEIVQIIAQTPGIAPASHGAGPGLYYSVGEPFEFAN